MAEVGTRAVKPWMIPIERCTLPPTLLTAWRAAAPLRGSSRTMTRTSFPWRGKETGLAAAVPSSVNPRRLAVKAARILFRAFPVLVDVGVKLSSDL